MGRRFALLRPSVERDVQLTEILLELAGRDRIALAEFLAPLPEADRRFVLAALLIVEANRPEEAVRLATDFCQADPGMAKEYGYALMSTLARRGEIDTALVFVAAQEATMGESEDPVKWVRALYATWTKSQPALAAAHSLFRIEGAKQAEATQTVARVWATADPQAAVEYFKPFADGHRDAFSTALVVWVEKDPAAASRWITTVGAGMEVDAAVAALATAPAMREPEIATRWAQRIADPELRSATLTVILRQWAGTDLAAARRYAQASQELLPGHRATLIAVLERPPD